MKSINLRSLVDCIRVPMRYLTALGLATVAYFCLLAESRAQGTITFEGAPLGVQTQFGANPYIDSSGMQFGNITPQSDYLSGGGILGYPDNGSGYLEVPGGTLRFGFNQFPPGSIRLFSLLSFDAAKFATLPAVPLTVLGYKVINMGQVAIVTNIFTLDGINDGPGGLADFQTFTLDSQFQDVFRVDIAGRFSLDNVLVTGIPEPSSLALFGLAVGLALRTHTARRKPTMHQ